MASIGTCPSAVGFVGFSLSSGLCHVPGIVHVHLPECGFPLQWNQRSSSSSPEPLKRTELPKRLQLDPVSLVPRAIGSSPAALRAQHSARLHSRWVYPAGVWYLLAHTEVSCVQCLPWSLGAILGSLQSTVQSLELSSLDSCRRLGSEFSPPLGKNCHTEVTSWSCEHYLNCLASVQEERWHLSSAGLF